MQNEPIYHYLPQRSEAWHNLRLGKITGSSFYKLLGSKIIREKYLYDRASELITKAKADSEEFSNIHIKRGIDYEHIAKTAYICRTFNHVKDVGLVQLGKYLACSPDGLIDKEGMIEIKVPDSHNFLKQKIEITEQGHKAIPIEYYLQMQFNLYICNRQWCDYVLYNPKHAQVNTGLFIYKVNLDLTIHNQITTVIEQAIDDLKNLINKYHQIT
jgi:exodeoxyribonuclease (lambda-induced)